MTTENALPPDTNIIPTWESFNSDFITQALPVYCVVRPNPLVRLFVSANATDIGCTFAVSGIDSAPPSLLKEIAVRDVVIDGKRMIQISTSTAALFRPFYALLECVCESVMRENTAPQVALSHALRDWQTLLRSSLLLTEEKQSGLYGELWMLNRLMDALGPETSLEAWIGPSGQAHDFRVADSEFEVKTTTSEQRKHFINGLNQLRPSPEKRLYLVSLHLAQAGAIGGETLPELAVRTRGRFYGDSRARDKFDDLLESGLGFHVADYPHYPRRWQLRSAPRLIPVIDGCPRLVPDALAMLPASYAIDRVVNATYQIDVEGLGFPDGSELFETILPNMSSEGDRH
jgi:hypothetical protein